MTSANTETIAARRATSSIPIVMWLVPDPVAAGFVASLARPGGNVTGLTSLVPGLGQQYVELLREVIPAASRFAVVASPLNPRPNLWREFEAVAGRGGRPDRHTFELVVNARMAKALGVTLPPWLLLRADQVLK